MTVDEVMSHRVELIEANATAQEVADRMRVCAIGALPVISHGRLVGMVTDRDLVVRLVAHGRDPRHVAAREVMTSGPIVCLAKQSVEEAASMMCRHDVRRLVVVDEAMAPIGLLSVDDLALYPETSRLAALVLARAPEVRGVDLDGSAPDMHGEGA